MVAAILDQVACQCPDCVGPEAAALEAPAEEEVDPSAAVARVGRLVVLDQPGRLAAGVDHERGHALAAVQLLLVVAVLRLAPPGCAAGLGLELAELRAVLGGEWSQPHERAPQLGHAATTGCAPGRRARPPARAPRARVAARS